LDLNEDAELKSDSHASSENSSSEASFWGWWWGWCHSNATRENSHFYWNTLNNRQSQFTWFGNRTTFNSL